MGRMGHQGGGVVCVGACHGLGKVTWGAVVCAIQLSICCGGLSQSRVAAGGNTCRPLSQQTGFKKRCTVHWCGMPPARGPQVLQRFLWTGVGGWVGVSDTEGQGVPEPAVRGPRAMRNGVKWSTGVWPGAGGCWGHAPQ